MLHVVFYPYLYYFVQQRLRWNLDCKIEIEDPEYN